MDSQNLQLEISSSNGVSVVTPIGDIDMSKSADFRSGLRPVIEATPKTIIVDLSHVRYMDSSGVATLIEGLQLSKQENITFLLCSLSEGVKSIIELARLDKIFSIYNSKEQALEH